MKSIAVTQEQFDYLKTIKPHFCLPAFGGMISESYFMSLIKLINLFNFSGINYSIDSIVNESLVTRARNSLVAKMMQFDGHSTHLVFIDSDIEFEPDSVIKLLLANKDVVGGIYPKKALPISYVVNPIDNAQLEGSLLEVKRIGTGFICIKREVFEKMFERYAHLKYNDNIGLDEKYAPYKYALFDTSIDAEDNNNYLSEDYTFCDRWRAMGGQIWADLSISLTHVGYYKFKGISPLETAISIADKEVSAAATNSKVIKLTFDDGPSEYTRMVLDVLKKHDAKATFFVIGNHIAGNEELLKRMVDEGHEIGNHTLTHVDHLVDQDTAKFEIEETDRLILEACGSVTQSYRLPGNRRDTGVYDYLINQNKKIVEWDIEGNDWNLNRTNEDFILKTIIEGIQSEKPEYVINLHDGSGDSTEKQAELGGKSRIFTVKALEKAIPQLKELGYAFETISKDNNIKQIEPVRPVIGH